MPSSARFCWWLLLACSAGAAPRPSADAWKYDFRPGDHLKYAQEFVRELRGPKQVRAIRLKFTNHVIVAGERDGLAAVGFQRNRDSGELLSHRVKGRDGLLSERPKFEARLAQRPKSFSESNLFSSDGVARDDWQAVREASSRLLVGVHEIVALPPTAVKPGDSWTAPDVLGLRFQFIRTEQIEGDPCALVLGTAANTVRLRFWFCPAAGTLRNVEFEADYAIVSGQVHETLSLRLLDRRRGETISAWLASPETRQAALRALLQSPWATTSAEAAEPNEADDAQTARLVLAVAARQSRRSLADPAGKMTKGGHESNGGSAVKNSARGEAFPRLKPGALLRFTDSSPAYPYILRVPEPYRGDAPFPLLIYLSGGPGLAIDAANGSDDALAGSSYVVLYPDARGEMWWTNRVTERFPALLEEVRRTVNIDPRRVYIAGFSNGATGAVYYATLWPGQFAAVALLMGAGRCMSDFKLNVDKLAGTPVLLVHGDSDPIISTRCSEDLFKALHKISPTAPPQLHVLKKREHDVTIGADDGLTLQFLDAVDAKRRAQ